MKVQLRVKGTEEVRSFDRSHALRILRLPNSAYQLDTDSPFEFIDNELRRKKNKGDNESSSTKGGSTRSRKSRK
jgi:hypothetical protein